MYIEQISITDFRNFVSAEIEPAPSGITLFQGDNGSGKTNLLEAVAYCATLKSFRGAPATSMVRPVYSRPYFGPEPSGRGEVFSSRPSST